jgi:hypothetical protein
MKFLRLLPFCLSVLALPLVLTGCNKSGDDTSSTAGDTNAAPADTTAPASAPADTNTAPAATSAPAATTDNTNATPAKADTNTPPVTNSSM